MSLLDVEPLTDPGRLGFERDWEDLEDAGVRLPSDQRWLWDEVIGHGEEVLCITPRPIELPTGYRHTREPLICWDVEANTDRCIWYPQLVVVRNDPAWVAQMECHRAWNRFPSLLGVPTQMSDWQWDDEHPEPFRIWDLWPIHALDAEALVQAVVDWHDDEGYRSIIEVIEVDHGEMDLCDFAEWSGVEFAEHVHVDQEGQRIENDRMAYQECRTGYEALDAAIEDLTFQHPDARQGRQFIWPGDPKVPPGLLNAWIALTESSRRNSSAAIGSFPPWERDEVLIVERAYNQWLWSY